MASSFLYRTQTAGTSTKKFTFSCWAKLSVKGGTHGLFSVSNGWADGTGISFAVHDHALRIYNGANGVGGGNMNAVANRLFRDNSGWYHFHFMGDTDESTIANRLKVYVNNELQTLVNVGGSGLNLPAQGASWTNLGVNGQTMQVGRASYSGSHYFDGYISHAAFVDGTAVAPTSFGQTDSTSGIWKFKSPSGITWGNNGFHLKFENSGTLGLDSSGQTNNLTVSGNLKQSLNTPSNVHAMWNNLDNFYAASSFSDGNTTIATGNSTNACNRATLGLDKGKWYMEVKVVSKSAGNDDYLVGIISDELSANNDNLGKTTGSYAYYAYNGKIRYNNGYAVDPYGATYTAGDIIGIALDLDNNKLYFSKNGTWQNSGDPTSGSTGTGAVSITDPSSQPLGVYFFAATLWQNSAVGTFNGNFGDGFFGTTAISSAGSNGNGSLFEYDVPSGYYAVNTKNINTYG